jgi:hypothetical protein
VSDSPCTAGAVHTWPIATNRALQFFGRYWGTADIELRWRPDGSVAIDPEQKSLTSRLGSDYA